jgi:hypothetical protein
LQAIKQQAESAAELLRKAKATLGVEGKSPSDRFNSD